MFVVYINLDRATVRNASMQDMFAARGINARRISAIDGALLSDADCRAVARPRPGFQHLAKAEIGCFLSHRKAWAEIADSPFDWGGVFEDDMLLAEDSDAFLASTAWIPRKAHLVKLETFPLQRLALGQNHIIPYGGRSLAKVHLMNLGAGGYLIRRDVAARLLARTQTFSVPVDHAIFDPAHVVLSRLNIYQLCPAICIQQINAPDIAFMPDEAELSMIEDGRSEMRLSAPEKYTGWSKIKREILRIGRQVTELFVRIGPKSQRRQISQVSFAHLAGDSFTHGSK